jgi:TonB family protein
MSYAAPHDLLDRKETLGGSLARSVVLHGMVLAAAVGYAWLGNKPVIQWGDENPMGGPSMPITPVDRIPLPGRNARVNPVANDTESQAPQAPKPETKQEKKDPREAVNLKGREAKDKQTKRESKSKYVPPDAQRDNRVPSTTGAAAGSEMYGMTSTGGGAVGTGTGGPLGSRFGAHLQFIRDKVARAWRTNEVDPRLQTAPPVLVSVEILRNGTVKSIDVLQSSGNRALDYSCQRAVYNAAPFPELPRAFERYSAIIEFMFQLKR